MNLIRKPKSCRLGGHKLTFRRSPRISELLEACSAVGRTNYVTGVIEVHDNIPEGLEHVTNLHEIVHQILNFYNYHELNNNEQFVDNMAQGLYQVLKTLK